MRTTHRCRAYPSAEQQAMLSRTFGCVRVVWKRTLAARRARYPRFESRHGRQSATFTRSAFRMKGTDLHLAKMSAPLKVVWTWPGTSLASLSPTSVTVARDPAGQWLVTFHAEVPGPVPLPATGQAAGIDLGLTDFAVLSDGQRIPHPRHMDVHERRLQRYQRRLARCQKGSASRAKAARKVARAHARVTDARRDFLHQASTGLTRRYDILAVEDLVVKNMVRNRKLARAISRTGWAEFRRQLEYKAQRNGRTVLVADRWFPSSKTCSACGILLADLSLETRQWACPACGTRHDRDLNAARNILAAGLAAAAKGGDACGADVRHEGKPPVQTAVKQEPRPARAGIPAMHGGE
jgi:putative transposase